MGPQKNGAPEINRTPLESQSIQRSGRLQQPARQCADRLAT